MTEQEARQHHIEMWTWLEANPSKRKKEWPGWEENGGDVAREGANYCLACVVASTRRIASGDGRSLCSFCPAFARKDRCADGRGLLPRWHYARSEDTRREYAAVIRAAWRENAT